MKRVSKNRQIYIYFFVFLFLLLMFVELAVNEEYVKISETNITATTRKNIKEMIKEKKDVTFDISQIIAHNRNVIKIMESGEYGRLRSEFLFDISKYYTKYRHLSVYIIDKNGIYVYTPFGEEGIKNNTLQESSLIKSILFSKRADRIDNYKYNPKFYEGICISKKGIVFKGISPIYDYSGNLLGLVEVDTHFNSIVERLESSGVDSAVVVDKRLSKTISSPLSKVTVNGYEIINTNIKQPIIKLIKQHGINNLIKVKKYEYIAPRSNFITGYYVISIPIKNNKKETLGYYLGFMYDTYGLAKKETLTQIVSGLMFLIFLGMSYTGYKYQKMNKRLVDSLNARVDEQTKRNIELLYIDTLTQAFNKLKFDKDIVNAHQDTYIVMFDIKNFSKINSIYGFKTGDKVLEIVVKRVKNVIKKPLYRIHADEFVFISENYEQDILKIKEKFIKEPIYLHNDDVKLRLSFSFGVCKNDSEDALSRAAIAIKEAKKSPYLEFSLYKEQKVDTNFIKFNSLLYDALFHQKEAQIVPYFQGIINNKTKKIEKYEALARLVTKDNVYSPYFFLNIAQSSGFVYEITKIMADKAIKYIASVDDKVGISINITEDDLNKGHLADYIKEICLKYKFPIERITLEILEGITSSGTKNNVKKLKELKDLGLKLALDDFGVEYSNFERISELDIDFIKIDAKYIKNLTKSSKSRKIAKAITDFAHSIDIEVVAEFVDSEETQKIVESLGIEYSQGYLFSVPNKEIESIN